jgi:uncharacterized protein YdeI (YjbR/CyaY-like superfamily)
MKNLSYKELDVYSFESQDDFYEWLRRNHMSELGFWLRYYKKASGKPTVVHVDAVDVALCWGWIDGLINKYDEISYVVRFTPRRPKSTWSKVNIAKVIKLVESGKMQPEGLIHVESAKADGRWEASYGNLSTTELPEEFRKMLSEDNELLHFYESLNKANKFSIAFRIATTVGEEKKNKVMGQILKKLKDNSGEKG